MVTDVVASGTLNVVGKTTLGGMLSVSKLATFESGANMNNKKITGVAGGDYSSADSTEAVNGGQLYEVKQSIKTYADGDGITITGDENTISVNKGDGIAVLFASDEALFPAAEKRLLASVRYSDAPPPARPLVLGVVG